ncbi:helix-turn-helix transcriptional regulator [Iamia sp. SCSIO 61187]|nr:helix-turn-helix transcriptional regulator [Iamia sp. SCSIO 61187]
MRGRGVTQVELANLVGASQAGVSSWLAGKTQPRIDTIWRLEEILEFPPGGLSRMLGFLPITAARSAMDLNEAIDVDPALSQPEKDVVHHLVTVLRSRG